MRDYSDDLKELSRRLGEAHGFAGDHMFISTLLIDDPDVADEASLPTFSYSYCVIKSLPDSRCVCQ